MNHLTFPRKFGLVSLLFVWPLVLVLFLLQSEFSSRIEFSSKELLGNRTLRPLRAVLEHVIESRILVHDLTSVPPPLPPELIAKLVQIEGDINTLQVVDRGVGRELKTTQEMAGVADDWQKLGKMLANASPNERDELHLTLLRGIQRLIALVGDNSNLILDPDLDSYYLMDSILLKLPEGADLVGRLQIHLRRSLARGPLLSTEDRIEFIRLSELIRANLAATRNGLQVAFNNNPAQNLKPSLNEDLQSYLQA
ncbi:MAG: signal transduction histidine kinase, partial [Planctomycetota bacterium]